ERYSGSLSHDLQVVDNPDVEHLVVLKGHAIRGPLLDLGDCRQNIVQPIQVALTERSRPGKPIPVSRVSPSRRWLFDFCAQQALELQLECRLVEEACSILPRYEQIDVAIRAGFAARNRPD